MCSKAACPALSCERLMWVKSDTDPCCYICARELGEALQKTSEIKDCFLFRDNRWCWKKFFRHFFFFSSFAIDVKACILHEICRKVEVLQAPHYLLVQTCWVYLRSEFYPIWLYFEKSYNMCCAAMPSVWYEHSPVRSILSLLLR